jgi:predicted nucleic acid-binding protein
MAKKKVICDTDVMIEYWDKTKYRHSATLLTLEQSIELDNVVLSAITKMELMLDAVNKTDMARIIKQLNRFNIALINNDITLQAFDLLQRYRLSHGLSLPDSIIAATALITDLELYTYNTKDFMFISQLKLYVAVT